MRLEILKIWVGGRARVRLQFVEAFKAVVVLAEDVDYQQALDLAVRWKVRHRRFGVPVRVVRDCSNRAASKFSLLR